MPTRSAQFTALLCFGVSATVFACANNSESTTPKTPPTALAEAPKTPAPAVANGPALPSVDKSALNPSVAPCDDFYEYACGGWIKNTQIPADEAFWYRSFSTIQKSNEEILRGILETYARGENQTEPYAKMLGDAYAACMDEATIEKLGTKPLEPWLKAIDAIHDKTSLTKLLGRMQSELGTGVVFDESAVQDFGDASRVVANLGQSGLGMPEREYYLETSPKSVEIRKKYEAHVVVMMKLAGEPEAKAQASANRVLAIETALAKAWMSKEDRHEPKKIAHPAARADLGKVAPGIDWASWLESAHSNDVAAFNVGQPDYLVTLAKMIDGGVPIADWKTYLKWHVFRASGERLGKKFVDETFRWQQVISGAEKLRDRWKRCVDGIDSTMGEALAQPFIKKTLGTEGKQDTVAMVRAIEAAMHDTLAQITWMDAPTKKAAFEKLAKVANKIAYPDHWRNYDKLTIAPREHLLNMQRGSAFEFARQLAKIGKPVDRNEWQVSPPTVDAYYNAQLNEMTFPAGILQPPFYSPHVAPSTNFGAIGAVMGGELTRGFDDDGRHFDLDGNLKDWWSTSVNEEFEHRADCVKRQFDDYTVLDDLHVNGKLTLVENIVDLGGMKLAYKAFTTQSPTMARGQEFTPQQEFFLGYAQGWCGKGRDEAVRNAVKTNPHAPPKLRVNGPVSNFPAFAEAFRCKPGAKMVKKDRCEVW